MATKLNIMLNILIISAILTLTQSLSFDKQVKSYKDSAYKKNYLVLKTLLNNPVIYGFRAELPNRAITIDENGLTVIPDKQIITLRLFGNNFISGGNNERKIRIGFTAEDGKPGSLCSPNNDFIAHHVISNNVALVHIKLSETIRDKPYYLCYGFSSNDYNKYISDSEFNSRQPFWPKTTDFYYLGNDDALKLRVIGRQLAVGFRSDSENRDANIKMKLAQIVDDVDKIHKVVDEMQDWTP